MPVVEAGQLEPGGEEAGGLGALSGRDDDEHGLALCRTTNGSRARYRRGTMFRRVAL